MMNRNIFLSHLVTNTACTITVKKQTPTIYLLDIEGQMNWTNLLRTKDIYSWWPFGPIGFLQLEPCPVAFDPEGIIGQYSSFPLAGRNGHV